jgi:hypothetical protein
MLTSSTALSSLTSLLPIRIIARNYSPRGHSCATLLRADWLAGNKRGYSCVIAGGIVARR